jgi:Na+/H+ antiporter NhaD/arsenite permease-like protein
VIATLVIFIATYVVLAGGSLPGLKLDRPGAALAGAVAMVAFRVLTPQQVYGEAISWDTLGLLLGMMILCSAMEGAGLFGWVAHAALRRAHGRKTLLAALVLLVGALSAVLVNDTVCVMFTPVVLALTEAAALPPLPYLLAICFAANAGSVATLTGNPQNMLIGTLSGISYARFAAALILPAALSVAAVLVVLLVAFRRELRGPLPDADVPRPPVHRGSAILCAVALVIVVAGFLLGFNLAWTALFGAGVVCVFARVPPRDLFAGVDGALLLFFAGLFVVTHGVAQAGIAERIHHALAPFFGDTAGQQLFRFGLFTVAACQLVSNVPFVLLAAHWVPNMQDPHLQWLALALVSTLAGNLTPVASVANLIVLETAGEKGRVGFWRFLSVGAFCTFLPLALGLLCLLAERSLLR